MTASNSSRTRRAIAAALAGGALVTSGCSSGSSDSHSSTKGTIGGKLGTGYSVAGKPMANSKGITALSNEAVDEVWAVPLYNGSISSWALKYKQVLPIQSDGSFSFPVPNNNTDYILVLVDTAECQVNKSRASWTKTDIQTRRACVKGYVTLKDATTSDALIGLPTSKMTQDLSLGDVNAPVSGDEAVSEDLTLEQAAQSFSFNADGLRAIARSGAMLKMVKNVFANFNDDVSMGVDMLLDYTYQVKTPAALTEISSGWATPRLTGDYPEFSSYYIYLTSNVDAAAHHAAMKTTANYAAIVAPGAVKLGGVDVNAVSGRYPVTHSTVIGNCEVWRNGDSCSGGSLGSVLWSSSDVIPGSGAAQRIGTGAMFTGGLAPAGDWELEVDHNTTPRTLASYELALGTPYADNDKNKPRIPLPSIKANVNSTTKAIESIQIKWYTYNIGGNSFVELSDSVAYEIVKNVMIYGVVKTPHASCPDFADYNYGGQLNAANNTNVFKHTYLFPGAGANCELSSIDVQFEVAGTRFTFSWSE